MNTLKAIFFAAILSFLLLGCETVKEANAAPSATPSIDQAIIGKWGLSPALIKASGGTNIIPYDFHQDGTVTQNIVMKDNVAQNKGIAGQTFQADNGIGQMVDSTGGKTTIRKFTYSISRDVLKLDSDDPSYGANGLHRTFYRVVE